MRVTLYGKKYYAKRDRSTNYTFLYSDILHYILDIPSMSLTMMYTMHNSQQAILER